MANFIYFLRKKKLDVTPGMLTVWRIEIMFQVDSNQILHMQKKYQQPLSNDLHYTQKVCLFVFLGSKNWFALFKKHQIRSNTINFECSYLCRYLETKIEDILVDNAGARLFATLLTFSSCDWPVPLTTKFDTFFGV